MANNSNTPTFKQKRFAREYVKNKGNGKKAALAAYDTQPEHAASLAVQVLEKPVVQQEIRKVLNESGLGLNEVGNKLSDAIGKGLDSGKASVSDALKGLDMVLKLHNAYPANKSVKLNLSRHELTTSKDLDAVFEDLKKLNTHTTSLISSSN